MALNFQINVPTTAGRTATVREFTDEFKAEFAEAWGYLAENPTHTMSVEFPDAATRDAWFDNCKAYGMTLADKVNIRRVKGTDSMNTDHGKLTFAMELDSVREARNAEKREAAAKVEARRAAGEVITKGRPKKGTPAHFDNVPETDK